MTQSEMFKQFNALYGVGDIDPTRENLEKALGLILDEVKEAYEELFMGVVIDVKLSAPREEVNLHNVAKEIADVRYIAGERATAFKFDVSALDGEVHRSNMSKGSPDCDGEEYYWAIKEADIAKERYPSAFFEYVGPPSEAYVIKCGKTQKVIKPTTYSPAEITDEMIGL